MSSDRTTQAGDVEAGEACNHYAESVILARQRLSGDLATAEWSARIAAEGKYGHTCVVKLGDAE
jgi:hypothetical protein